jgi:hypothetical protein
MWLVFVIIVVCAVLGALEIRSWNRTAKPGYDAAHRRAAGPAFGTGRSVQPPGKND